ncbi:hypothetical protein, partial [uncultured Nostoc sp.]|uniref:hypothetical protein n=1 Tax=uncultured Nostoc sp. TaxID=340711 RepID=UPI0035CB48E2
TFLGLRVGLTTDTTGLLSIFLGLRVGLTTDTTGLLSTFLGLRVGLVAIRLPLIFTGCPRLGSLEVLTFLGLSCILVMDIAYG